MIMGDLGDYQYVALKRLKAGTETVQPGDLIPLETSRLFGRGKVRTLIQTGWIAAVGPAATDGAEEAEVEAEETPKRRGGRRKRVEEPKEEQPDDVDVRGGPDELATGRDPASDG